MAQQLLLDVVHGSLKGQTFVVPANVVFVVGRLPDCGLSIPEDLTVSRQHFQIEYRPPECQLTHLSHSSVTSVNDKAVDKVTLKNGDQISFGTGNRIRARLVERTSRAEVATITFDELVAAKIPCGWNEYHSSGDHPNVDEIVKVLDSQGHLHAMLDLRRLAQPASAEWEQRQFLFGWLPPEIAEQHSPVFVAGEKSQGLVDFLVKNWGKDGIVLCGSELADDELLSHWRTSIGAKGNQAGNSMMALYTPSLLEMVLTHQSTDAISSFVRELKWLLIESKAPECGWKLYCSNEFASGLPAMGLAIEQGSATKKR